MGRAWSRNPEILVPVPILLSTNCMTLKNSLYVSEPKIFTSYELFSLSHLKGAIISFQDYYEHSDSSSGMNRCGNNNNNIALHHFFSVYHMRDTMPSVLHLLTNLKSSPICRPSLRPSFFEWPVPGHTAVQWVTLEGFQPVSAEPQRW